MAEDDDAGRTSEDEVALEYSWLFGTSVEELRSDSVKELLESEEFLSAGLEPSSELLDN